jgi:hypothetical protein
MFGREEKVKEYKYIGMPDHDHSSCVRFETFQQAVEWAFKYPHYEIHELGKKLNLKINVSGEIV